MDSITTSQSHAEAAPIVRQSAAASKPPPKRDRRRRPAKIDKRSGVWLRILELKAIYESGLADRVRSPLLEARIHEAAMLMVTAEVARARFLKGEAIRIDAVVSAERVAKAAVDKLHLADAVKKAPSLREYLAKREGTQ
jgi:hypothetical protein